PRKDHRDHVRPHRRRPRPGAGRRPPLRYRRPPRRPPVPHAERLDALTGELDGEGIRARGFTADVLDPASLTAALDTAAKELGSIEVLQFSPVPRADFMKPVLDTSATDLDDP